MAAMIHAKVKNGNKLWYLRGATGNKVWTKEYPTVKSRSDIYAILRTEFGLPKTTNNTDIVFLLFNKTWDGEKWVDDFTIQLKSHREKKCWTQGQLAEKAGLSVQAVAALEQGTRGPTWETVLKLAHALGIAVEDFRIDGKSMKWSDSSGQ
jgi:DNA-binding XRE family transcriptional regulator